MNKTEIDEIRSWEQPLSAKIRNSHMVKFLRRRSTAHICSASSRNDGDLSDDLRWARSWPQRPAKRSRHFSFDFPTVPDSYAHNSGRILGDCCDGMKELTQPRGNNTAKVRPAVPDTLSHRQSGSLHCLQ
jgi:hypothetical protein